MESATAAGTKQSSNGSALLVVLVILGIIAALAVAVARSVSGAALELSSARANAESESDLRAGIELGVAAILKLDENMRSAEAAVDLTGRRITVQVTNERARIDINMAKPDVLAGLLEAEGVDATEAEAIAAGVAEWRGGDPSQKLAAPTQQDDHHMGAMSQWIGLNNATGGATKTASKPTPSLRIFMHPIQLVSLPGISNDLFKRLFPFITIANGANKINPFIAAPEVLKALPGASESKVEAFVEARSGNVSHDTALEMLGVDKSSISEERASGWRLRITSISRAGRARRSEAIIANVSTDDNEPYRVVYVVDDRDQYARQALLAR